MRKTILQCSLLMSVPSIIAIAACSSDNGDSPRRGFDVEDAGREATANLPPPPPEPTDDAGKDASSRGDAGESRDPYSTADEPVSCAAAGSACAKQIVAGKSHFCVLMTDGTARCWGSNEYGALGSDDESSAVRAVVDLTDATQLSSSRFTTCARKSDSSVQCWGSNSFGNLGITSPKGGGPTWDEFPHPRASTVTGLGSDAVTRVDVGPQNACAVLASGEVSCWGTNQLHQLARPSATTDFVMAPGAATLAPYNIAFVRGSTGTMLGRTTTGEVVSWAAVAGDDGFVGGRLTSISPDPAPNTVAMLKGVTNLAVTESLFKGEGGPLGVPDGAFGPFPPPAMRRHAHACAIANGEVFCWGRSDTGALCTGLPDDEIVPRHAPIKGKPWPQQLALGDELTCARMTDGSVQCCGADGRGRLGTTQSGNRVEVFSAFFRRIDSFKGHAVQIATSDRAVCALNKDGSVECWGSNQYGELALPADEVAHPTPVKVELGLGASK